MEEDLKQLQKERQKQVKTNQLKLVELRKNISEEATHNHQKNRSELMNVEKGRGELKKRFGTFNKWK